MSGFLVSITVPPSVNNLFVTSGRRRFKSKGYRAWIKQAGLALMTQRPKRISGPYRLFLTLPKIRGDIANREKAISDLLVAHSLVDDDRFCVGITIASAPEAAKGFAVVSAEGVEARAA